MMQLPHTVDCHTNEKINGEQTDTELETVKQ